MEIPLKNIPASGVSGWWNLEKPETKKQKARGEIHLTMTLSTEKDPQLTSQEHRYASSEKNQNHCPICWSHCHCIKHKKVQRATRAYF